MAIPSSVPGQSPWIVLAVITPIYFFTFLYRLAPSVLAPDLAASLGTDMAGVSLISGVTWISYGLMQLPSGLMVDALGGRKGICLLTLLAAAGNVCFALSETLSQALGARLILGVGCAVCVPCCAVLAQSFRPEFYSRANSVFLALGMAGGVFAGAPLVWASEYMGWRAAMLACAALSCACAALVWFCIQDTPSAGEAFRSTRLGDGLALMGRNALRVWKTAAFWPYCLWYAFMVGAYFTVTSLWWAPYLREGCGLSPERAGDVISVVCLVMLPAQPIIASFSDFFHTRKKVVVACSLMALLASVVLPLYGARMSMGLLAGTWLFFLVGTGYVSAVLFAAVKEIFPLEMVGTALGCLQTLPYVVAVPVMQRGFSHVLAWRSAATGGVRAGYADAMYLLVAFLFAGLAASLFMREPDARRAGASAAVDTSQPPA